ncbi:MAG TPA: MerR family transcriptional regulator [Desulfomonilaceae bacterium]|nr:MerR family transcriptional regulator [Desulfomonilaceae bacterium]
MVAGFGAKVVKDITGVSRMQLQHWDRTGIVRPSIKIGAGKGSRREYSFKDLVQLKVAKRLRDEGISLQKIRKALEYLRKNFPDVKAPLAELRFLTNGVDLFVLTMEPQVILDALRGQFIFSFALGELIDGLKGSIKNLEIPREEKVFVGEREFTAVLKPDLEDGGYTITCNEIPAAISQGETIQEALDNLVDAIELCLEAEAEMRNNRVQAR